MTSVLTEIISILVAGITDLAGGIGEGLGALVTSIFLTEGTGGEMTLSVFGGVVVIFAGISLAIGLSRLIFNWVTSLGNN